MLGALTEAAEACRAALRHDPQHLGALRMLADFAASSGNFREAVELYTRAIGLPPQDPGTQNALGTALKGLGRLDEAEIAHRKALQLDPLYAPAHQSLGELFHYRGQLEGARLCFETSLELDPTLTHARIGLGNTLLDLGEFQAAVDEYRGAIVAGQTSGGPLYINLGVALKELGDAQASIEAFRQAVTGNPNSGEAHVSLGSAFLDFGQFADALASLREGIRLRPDIAVAHVLYGTALAALGDFDGALRSVERGSPPGSPRRQLLAALASKLLGIGLHERALACFKKQLEDDPQNVGAQHFVAALSNQNPDRPDESYVRNLFDQFAATFDQHLVAALGYTTHKDLIDALLAASSRTPPWDVLDLGCGTGLVGREIATHARNLVGVDLSPKMIARARESGVYTKLKLGELGSALNAELQNHYDVVSAADVFIYMGKLDAVVPAVHRVLRPRGMFAFTVEAAETDSGSMGDESRGYRLMPTGRYAHYESYLRELAAANAFDIKLFRRIRLRTEHRRPVMGWITVWARESSAS